MQPWTVTVLYQDRDWRRKVGFRDDDGQIQAIGHQEQRGDGWVTAEAYPVRHIGLFGDDRRVA